MIVLVVFLLIKHSIYSGDENKVYQTGSYRRNNLSYLNSDLPIDTRVRDLIGRMTVDEKIGQMVLVEKNSIGDPLDIARYSLGAVMSGLGAKPDPNTPTGWLEMVNKFRRASERSRLGVPILYGVDTNHGHSNVPGATIFPHAIGLGATHDVDLVRRVAQATAEEMMATGIFWSFSPSLDIALDNRWGRMYETFGSNTATVSGLGRAYIEGLQNDQVGTLMAMATAKHYIGLGAMGWGTSINKDFFIDQGETVADEATLRSTHLPPFKEAVESGVKSVMVGLNTWQGKKLLTSRYLLTDVLKGELDFEGIVVSDWYGVYEISPSKYTSLVAAVNAGVDMVMLPFDYRSFIYYMGMALRSGDIKEERLNDAVERILRVKFELGLFDKNLADIPKLTTIGSMRHREIARVAVRESLVLLKDRENILPLPKNTPQIFVAGSAADNLGRQFGGWTVEWQGIDGNWVPGTTILSGIKSEAEGSSVHFNERGEFSLATGKADVGIVIVGEKPYAEGWGDNKNPSLSEEDLSVIQKVKVASNHLIVIIISGRPLDIKKYAKDWDIIIAAWLPGSEGDGVSDVLFGDYPFTGNLPVAWDLE